MAVKYQHIIVSTNEDNTTSCFNGKTLEELQRLNQSPDDNNLLSLIKESFVISLDDSISTISIKRNVNCPNFIECIPEKIVVTFDTFKQTLINGKPILYYWILLEDFKRKGLSFDLPLGYALVKNDILFLSTLEKQKLFYKTKETRIGEFHYNEWDKELYFGDVNMSKIMRKIIHQENS